MATYLPPVERPRGLIDENGVLLQSSTGGQGDRAAGRLAARMPVGFGNFYGKVSKLDKKLQLPSHTAVVIREQVASINSCLFCMDAARWYTMKESTDNLARFDALGEYRTSPLFTEAERAALDYATELTRDKLVEPETFARLARCYGEREICDIVWLVASEHLYNMNNIGLNVGSDDLCQLSSVRMRRRSARSRAPAGLGQES